MVTLLSSFIRCGFAGIGIAKRVGSFYIFQLHYAVDAQVVKLVNTRDLKSLDLGLAGSSPALGTISFLFFKLL